MIRCYWRWITVGNELFKRTVIVKTSNNITLKNADYKITFDVPFDDDMDMNTAEVTVCNLTDSTINKLRNNDTITIEAGYHTDTGIICSGRIANVSTKHNGIDKITTIDIKDGPDLSNKSLANKTYANGTKASYILRDLANLLGLAIAKFQIPNDVVYWEGYVVDGNITDAMENVAMHCGIGCYIHKSKLYIRPITSGDDLNFTLSVETGMLGSPEAFSESTEVTEEDMKYVSKSRMKAVYGKWYIMENGYKVNCLLQHRFQVASIVNLKARGINARCRVKRGTHSFDSDFKTELEMVEV